MDFGPLLAAVGAAGVALVGGWLSARRLARAGLSTEQLQVNTTLRELADVKEAKVVILTAENATLRAKLEATQNDLDTCERQLFKERLKVVAP